MPRHYSYYATREPRPASLEEAALYVGVGVASIVSLVERDPEFPRTFKKGGVVCVDLDGVDRWMHARRREARTSGGAR